MTILYILLFLLCLSVLIVVHEAGHLAAAKAFKVYCTEFSIGMGPAILSKKRKGGETKFSWRAIPFGGYVAMYGEGETELPEGVTIPSERSLTSIKKWKRAIIMAAGVAMNVILALIIFFVCNACFVQQTFYINQVGGVKENSPAALATDVDGNDFPLLQYDVFNCGTLSTSQNYILSQSPSYVTNKDGSIVPALGIISGVENYKNLNLCDFLYFTTYTVEDEQIVIKDEDYIQPGEGKVVTLFIDTPSRDEDGNLVTELSSNGETKQKFDTHRLTIKCYQNEQNWVWEDIGLKFYYNEYWNNFGQAVQKTFTDFGSSATLIVRGLGSLFTGGAKDVGGIIAIGFQTTSVLKNLGFAKFLFYWGIISVNLAIVNLIPFPGLDGWHLLVLAIEGITRKKVPDKAKNIVSFIGLVILIGLMVLLVVKDLFTYL